MTNRYNEWLIATANDKEANEALLAIREDEEGVNDRFYCDLAFGTGGLRGKLGIGTNRMNVYTVGRATKGLAEYVLKNYAENRSVAIAYDSRNKSREFAFLAADIMSSKGIKAYVFEDIAPTPLLSFAARRLKTSVGIVITASHNPKEYNGYKVYNDKGCQITEEAAKEITEEIKKADYFSDIRPDKSIIVKLGDEILDKFVEEIKKYSYFDKTALFAPKIVYSPLNGTGNKPVRRILREIGATDVAVVPEQENPDGNFPTCPYPNPEEREALVLALDLAKNVRADLVLATDPDADRIGIAVRDKKGEYRLFNGNETGVVMMDYIFSMKKEKGLLPKNPTAVKTIVTSDMAAALAEDKGASVRDVLTGFKYIGETIDNLPSPDDYVFGMEESYGYLVGTHVRDKDAVSAAMTIVEAAAFYRSKGLSLIDVLDGLYEKYGYYKTKLLSFAYPGEKGKEQMDAFTATLRKNPWKEICGEACSVKDYSLGIEGLPKSNVLSFKSEDLKIIVRPSGTEPKIKFYLTAKKQIEEASDAVLEKMEEFVKSQL